ncbi:hypothetical protein B1R94_13530 [Mycolicibacterium litorale]|nr:hypothetical protein B1R94_13530 [Mycolicibacterium litorale]
MRQLTAAAVIAGGLLAGTIALAAPSSATSCNAADCVPNVARNVVGGTPCTPGLSFVFGFDSANGTLICSAGGVWTATGPLVGEGAVALPCAIPGSTAQERLAGNTLEPQVPGVPLICTGPAGASRWAHFDLP